MKRFLAPLLRTLFKPVPDMDRRSPADSRYDASRELDAAVCAIERAATDERDNHEARINATFDDLFRIMGKRDANG